MLVERLTDELEIAKACETLEIAREAMHADRNVETVTAYKASCETVAGLRSAFRMKYPLNPPVDGDGQAAPPTVQAHIGVTQ